MSQFASAAVLPFQDKICVGRTFIKPYHAETRREDPQNAQLQAASEGSSILLKLGHYLNSLFLDAGSCAIVPGHE
ncbi:MAG: hypothetical protein WCA20_02990 [Candidatus Sulfotelmatobacter sp.]